MIDKIKNIIWKVEGMDYSDNPSGTKGLFHLMYGDLLIGELSYINKIWTFKYSEDFKKNKISPITDFPDTEKVYTTKQLWPFFAARIPSINQPFQYKKIAKANADKNDSVALLKIFGKMTITNPFQLIGV